jgi:hypothetical protein
MGGLGELVGSCHCGRATIRLPRKPESVTQCNCSLCAKTGFSGVYYGTAELEISAEFDSSGREDFMTAYLGTHRCAHCGTCTHWTPLGEPPHERMGVNARLFDEAIMEGVPVQEVDGRSWDE